MTEQYTERQAELARRLAELVVTAGANVQPGQIVAIGSETGKEHLTREIADAAYRAGAKFVDVSYFDPWVKRSRILHAPEDTLDFVPSWYGDRVLALGDEHAARIGLTGNVAPGLMADLDPARVGRDMLPSVKESGDVVAAQTTNWSVAPAPTHGWARLVHPELDQAAAMDKLWDEIAHVCRLDTDDPTATLSRRFDHLLSVAGRLTERRFDSLHFEGPGTDFTVGLLPSSKWIAARFETVDGIVHFPNIPSEEMFTTPDPQRAEGVVRSTKPLDLSGTVVRGLEVRFEGGRVVDINADEGAAALRSRTEMDEGAARLGEVALVDREGRVGPLGTVFYDTLLDENAASHVALGRAYPFACEDEADVERSNVSAIHIDFMIGSEEVGVTGVTTEGDRVPVLRGGDWQI
jgi:aminopeptidase